MGCAKYVGRVGALAVALGIGSAIAGAAGVAVAEPTNPDTASATEKGQAPPPPPAPEAPASKDDAPPPAQEPADPDENAAPESATESTVEVADGVVVSSSGGPHTSTHSASERVSKKSAKPRQTATPSSPSTPESTTSNRRAVDADTAKPSVSSPAPSVAKQSSSEPTFATTATVRASVPQPSTPPAAAPAPIVNVVLSALAAAFGATGGPTSPVQSPMAWVVTAVARRDLGEPLDTTAAARTSAVTLAAAAPNQPPTNPVATVSTPNSSTGVVTGTVSATDPDGDTLTYTTPANTTKGSVSITSTGAFTYTPTAAARHAAAAVGATTAKEDTFTVTIKDPYGGTTTKAVTVTVLGKNTAPTGYAYVGYPNGTTGVVTGSISAGDNDYDPLSYSATNTTKGTITVTNTGAWTYTPTAAARHAAAAVGAPATAKQDTFTIAVKDGYGGTANINVTVTVLGKNTAPVNPIATVGSPNSSGVVTGTVSATDADGDILTYTAPTSTPKGTVSITPAGAFTYTPTSAARRTAALATATAADKQDTFTVTINDGYGATITKTVTVTVLARSNAAPANPIATVGTPNSSGVVTGTVSATDPDGDTLTYTTPANTTKGSVSITSTGAFTYTPTAAARHAAAAVGATTAKEDTFTVTIKDPYGGTTTKAVTVTVLGKNTAPTGYAYVGYPNGTTGVVTGSISAGDNDYDPLSYSATNTTKGTITVTNTGAWTYTPTAAARHAAAAVGAPATAKQDTFTIAVKDGYGGTANINVTVTVLGKNTAPTNASATVTNTNVRTGVVTGVVTVVDPDDSTFTYTSTTSAKGSLAFGGNGSFTYTPTLAARQAATAPNATTATKTDTFTITINDGYGGRATTVLNVAVTPLGINGPITTVNTTVGQPNQALGVVEGTVKGVDPEGDALTYTLTGGPSRGAVTVDAATGAFTYTPTVQARYDATVGPGQVVDGFTVRVADAFGASTSVAVTAVPVAPYVAWAIDQRPTSVGVTDPYLFYASQAETDAILDALQASGVDTVRIHVPWAWVEPVDDTYDWTAIDRMVDSARARNMTVLATLNHTPQWAATPGTPALSGVPADPQKYADFASAVATRYAGRISAYEVWNEPNGKMFWEPEPNAAQYTALLRAAYPAIKLADPNATVLAGSMGNVPDTPGESIHAVRFLEQMYANGAAGYFDALAYHPYQYWVPFSDADVYQVHPRTQMEAMHQLMVANGDGEKLIWATEYGQPAVVGGELQQAEYLADFLRTWREIDYAGPAYLYTTRDDASTNPTDGSFGLFRADLTRKAAIGAVEEVIDENDAADEARNL